MPHEEVKAIDVWNNFENLHGKMRRFGSIREALSTCNGAEVIEIHSRHIEQLTEALRIKVEGIHLKGINIDGRQPILRSAIASPFISIEADYCQITNICFVTEEQ